MGSRGKWRRWNVCYPCKVQSVPPQPPIPFPSLTLSFSPKADLSSWVVHIYSGGLCVQANPSPENRAKGHAHTHTHKSDRGRGVIPHSIIDSPSWFSMRQPTRVMNCSFGMTNLIWIRHILQWNEGHIWREEPGSALHHINPRRTSLTLWHRSSFHQNEFVQKKGKA